MATGDAAAAAGMDLVSGSTAANTIDTEINKTRDYIAQTTPVSRGGTGAASAAAALTNLGAVPASEVYEPGDSIGNKIPRYSPAGKLLVSDPTAANEAASKAYVDANTGDYVGKTGPQTMSGNLFLPNATLASSSYVVCYLNGDGRVSRGASSRRYKKNIKTAPRDAFGQVLDLRPVTFQWRNNVDRSDHVEVGLIAEEVAEAVPWLTVYNDAGEPEAVAYERLGLALIPVVQAQQQQISELLARVARLEGDT